MSTLRIVLALGALALGTTSPAWAQCQSVDPDPLTGERGKVHRWYWIQPYDLIAQTLVPPGPVSSTVTSFSGQVRWAYDLTELGFMDRPISKGTPVVLTLGDGSTVNLPISREAPARLMNRESHTQTLWRVTLDVPMDVARRLAGEPPLGLRVDLEHDTLHGVFRPAPARRISGAFSCVLDP
ncbi:MAG: hypothetical protein EA397_01245 [Deltaproteobacteria bacterium]|nr:MAG: hypothetical protein EA397_01245 [Deltaproteobacteria bacterium]